MMSHLSAAASTLQEKSTISTTSFPKGLFAIIEQYASRWRIFCFLSILTAYLTYTAIGTGMFIRYRKDYYIAKRGFRHLIWCSVLQALHISILMAKQINRDRYPRFLLLWANNVILPTFLFSANVGRAFSLLHEYYWNKHKFHGISKSDLIRQEKMHSYSGCVVAGANSATSASSSNDGLPRSISPYSRKCSLIAAISGYSQQQAVYMQETRKPKWKEWYFCVILNKQCERYLPIFVLGIHFLVNCFIQAKTSEYEIFPSSKYGAPMSKGELFPNYLSLLLYSFVFSPLVLKLLSGVEDAFNIKRDTKRAIYVGIPLYMFFLLWRHTTWMTHFQEHIASFWFIVLGMVLFQTFNITIPVLHVMEQRKKRGRSVFDNTSYSTIEFKTLFKDSRLLDRFRKFSVTEFSVENIIFWEVIQEYKSLFPYSHSQFSTASGSGEINSISKEIIEKTAKVIWETFFFLNSKYALNLSEEARKETENAVFNQPVNANTFDAAEKEVTRIMRTYTFPRFNQHKRQ